MHHTEITTWPWWWTLLLISKVKFVPSLSWHSNEKTTNFAIRLQILIMHLRIPILRTSAAEPVSIAHFEIDPHSKGTQTQFLNVDAQLKSQSSYSCLVPVIYLASTCWAWQTIFNMHKYRTLRNMTDSKWVTERKMWTLLGQKRILFLGLCQVNVVMVRRGCP